MGSGVMSYELGVGQAVPDVIGIGRRSQFVRHSLTYDFHSLVQPHGPFEPALPVCAAHAAGGIGKGVVGQLFQYQIGLRERAQRLRRFLQTVVTVGDLQIGGEGIRILLIAGGTVTVGDDGLVVLPQ